MQVPPSSKLADRQDMAVDFRPPAHVMRLGAMGASFPHRLSFMRCLTRRMAREAWTFERAVFNLDDNGFGYAVWRIGTPGGPLSFVAFSTALDPSMRTDRVIAERWDASFALLEGEATEADIQRLEANVPLQEAGRCSPKELVLSRANKSVRLFEHICECLSQGRQPDMAEIVKVGYLMRTTAVYGNGKFGLGDYDKACSNPSLAGPFRAEMLTVFMIRSFQFDLINHVAARRGGANATMLERPYARALGIGNSTGLGMAPFLIRHPVLFHRWIEARETALAAVRSVPEADADKRERYRTLLERLRGHVEEWNVDDERHQRDIEAVRSDLAQVASIEVAESFPWDGLYRAVEQGMTSHTCEAIASLLIELYPARVDDLEDKMSAGGTPKIAAGMPLSSLKDMIERHYDWVLTIDFDDPSALHHFWYYSQDKEEPRLGRRFEEPGAEKEMHIGMGWYVSRLHGALEAMNEEQLETSTARFLLENPGHRMAVKRVFTTAQFPYSEIRDNTVGRSLLPIDMLRCKLSFFGATKFDPRSDLWTRITMYQGAPLIDELDTERADDWWSPVFRARSC